MNADDTDDICATGTVLSGNLFAYCENNSINKEDQKGTKSEVFETKNRKKYNCYSYAIGYKDRWLHPGTRGYDITYVINNKSKLNKKGKNIYLLGSSYKVNFILKQVQLDLKSLGISYRYVKSKDVKLNKGEYLIAMRVATYPTLYKSVNVQVPKTYSYDFHFMKQDPKTKEWWNKSGSARIQKKGKINTDNKLNWPMPTDSYYTSTYYGYPAKSSKKYTVYYNSHTEYLVIKKKFWSK